MDAAYRGSSEGEGLSEAELQQRDLGFFFFLLMRTLGRYSQPTFAICQTARSFDFFAAPYISLHLPTSPHISLHLPTSPYISQARSFDFFAANTGCIEIVRSDRTLDEVLFPGLGVGVG
jgi:hypothetical protein